MLNVAASFIVAFMSDHKTFRDGAVMMLPHSSISSNLSTSKADGPVFSCWNTSKVYTSIAAIDRPMIKSAYKRAKFKLIVTRKLVKALFAVWHGLAPKVVTKKVCYHG